MSAASRTFAAFDDAGAPGRRPPLLLPRGFVPGHPGYGFSTADRWEPAEGGPIFPATPSIFPW
ncbi:MAG: hypothetical protein ACRECR_00450, partial [Thermoplasmata archaeon]